MVLALLLAGCSSLPTTVESVTWDVLNNYHRPVLLEFYSQDRNAAWPGGGSAYVLEPGKQRQYSLSCRSTEQICYGAWLRNEPDWYWGTGLDDAHDCTQCCMTCTEGKQLNITLSH